MSFSNQINGSYFEEHNITQIIGKITLMMSQLESGNIPVMSMLRLLDLSVWNPVINELSDVSMENIQFE